MCICFHFRCVLSKFPMSGFHTECEKMHFPWFCVFRILVCLTTHGVSVHLNSTEWVWKNVVCVCLICDGISVYWASVKKKIVVPFFVFFEFSCVLQLTGLQFISTALSERLNMCCSRFCVLEILRVSDLWRDFILSQQHKVSEEFCALVRSSEWVWTKMWIITEWKFPIILHGFGFRVFGFVLLVVVMDSNSSEWV